MPEPVTSAEKNWFALYIKPRNEFKVALKLDSVSVEYYLPTIAKVKKWSDRKKKITEPVFRGYIFIHGNEKDRITALTQDGVVRCVCFLGKPSIIPEWQIENLKKMLTEASEVLVSNKIEIGTKVKIIDGPFTDVVGVVTGEQEDKWLAVSVDLLRCSVMVRLPKESIIKFLEN